MNSKNVAVDVCIDQSTGTRYVNVTASLDFLHSYIDNCQLAEEVKTKLVEAAVKQWLNDNWPTLLEHIDVKHIASLVTAQSAMPAFRKLFGGDK